MPSSSKDKSNTFRLFIESPGGVVEFIVGVVQVDETPVFTPFAARVVSGEGADLSTATLQEAIELQNWASNHPASHHLWLWLIMFEIWLVDFPGY